VYADTTTGFVIKAVLGISARNFSCMLPYQLKWLQS